MQMPGRTFTSSASTKFRYGFNGKELDNDIAQGDLDFGARIYDSRIGRFLSVDPDSDEYEFQSVYCISKNNPLALIDFEGRGTNPPDKGKSYIYHRTDEASAADMRANGINPLKSKKSGMMFFSKTSTPTSIGSAAMKQNTLVSFEVNLEKVVEISDKVVNEFWDKAVKEANSKLNTTFTSMADIQSAKGKTARGAFRIAEGYFNEKFANYLSNTEGQIFEYNYNANEKHIAIKAKNPPKLKVAGFFGEGAQKANALYKSIMSSKRYTFLKSVAKSIFTASTFWEVAIPFAIDKNHQANIEYTKNKTLGNYFTDTYAQTGLGYYLGFWNNTSSSTQQVEKASTSKKGGILATFMNWCENLNGSGQ
jgi:RHS repeat-associated protein